MKNIHNRFIFDVFNLSDEHLLERIETDPSICSGKPHIRKTYMKVSTILELLSTGWDSDQILAEYPYISVDDIKACVLYAKNLVKK